MAAITNKHKVRLSASDMASAADIPLNAVVTNGHLHYTVVRVFPSMNELALSLHKPKPVKPFLIKFEGDIKGLAWENFDFELNAFQKRPVIEKASREAWERANARYNAILPIVGSRDLNIESKLDLYIRGVSLKEDIEACAIRSGNTIQSIYNWLNLYLVFGSHITALLPGYYVCGVGRPLPVSFEAGKGKRLGQGCISPYRYERVFNQEDQARLDDFIKKSLRNQNDYKITSLYSAFINLYCKDVSPSELQVCAQKHVNLSKYITYDQFYHHFHKTVDIEYLNECKKGLKQTLNDDARRLGVAQELSIGPSYLYEIDSTTLNVYVVTRVPDKNTGAIKTIRLGRPYLYYVVDIYSGMIVGYSITFKRNAMAAKAALYNAFTDKVAFCARYGIQIHKNEWACEHVCLYLFSDRGGDFREAILTDSLEADLGVEGISYATAYLSRMRGTVEVSFDATDKIVIQRLSGSVKRKPAKDSIHPSTESEVTIDQLNRLMIEAVLIFNRNKLNFSRLHGPDVFKGIDATPNGIWLEHIGRNMGGGLRKPAEEVRYALLNHGEARVFKDHIELNTSKVRVLFRTNNSHFTQRQVKLKTKTAYFTIKLRYNPDDFRFAWYADPEQDHKIIEFNLAREDRRFDELIEIEVMQQQRVEAASQSLNREVRNFDHINMAEQIEEINLENQCYGSKSKGKKSMVKGIDENSKIEAKVETLVETNETRKLFGFESSDFFASDKQFGGSDE